MEDRSVKEKFKFVLKQSEKMRVDYRCPNNERGYPTKPCPWRVFGSPPRISQRNSAAGGEPEALNIELDLRLQQEQCVLTHKCIQGGGDVTREVVNRQSWLQRNVPKWMPAITITTDVKTIKDTMTRLIKQNVNYEAARLLKVFLIECHLREQEDQFNYIPAYCTQVVADNPDAFTEISTVEYDIETGGEEEASVYRFSRVFVFPRKCIDNSFHNSRNFVALDGTFLKTRWAMVLLLAVGIDGDGKTMPLAWAVVESESTDTWTWFLENLQQCLPQIRTATIISDRDKGLIAAEGCLNGR